MLTLADELITNGSSPGPAAEPARPEKPRKGVRAEAAAAETAVVARLHPGLAPHIPALMGHIDSHLSSGVPPHTPHPPPSY